MEKIISYLTYNIGNETFATNVSHVQSIIEYSDLTKVPNMPDFFIGVMNLRSEVLPIVDSRIKLNIARREITKSSSIVVLELGNEQVSKVGLLVDGVSEVIEIEDENIEKAPEIGTKYNSDLIYGIYPNNDKFIMLLDVNKMLLSEINDPDSKC